MRRIYFFSLVVAFLAFSLAGMSILAHEGGGERAKLLKKATDPRTDQEKEKFQERDSIQKLAQILAELREVKVQMDKEGVYSCCVYRGCNWCPLMEAACTCRDNLKAGEPVCPECKVGWEAGLGAVDGFTAADVKTMLKPDDHKEGMEERHDKMMKKERRGRERP
jgi:hypothetical protein